MADKKISQLPAATTPLAGTEVLPIVQSNTTDQVSVANLTAGRAVSAASLTLSGGTAYGVAYLNASNVVTTGSAFTFDGYNPTTVYAGAGAGYKAKGSASSTNPDAGTNRGAIVSLTNLDTTDGNGNAIQFQNSNELSTSYVNGINVSHTGRTGAIVFGTSNGSYPMERARITEAGNLSISNGNLVIGTSGKGIDFSATASGSGTMTSELLADYEEGTWTPTDISGAGLTFTYAGGNYTKIGNQVTAWAQIDYPVTTNTAAGAISGLPFTTANNSNIRSGIAIGFKQTTNLGGGVAPGNNTQILWKTSTGGATTNVDLSGTRVAFSITYQV